MRHGHNPNYLLIDFITAKAIWNIILRTTVPKIILID